MYALSYKHFLLFCATEFLPVGIELAHYKSRFEYHNIVTYLVVTKELVSRDTKSTFISG
jgi:hypothetical protein